VVQLLHDLLEANVQRAERDLAGSLADLDRKLLHAAVEESLAARSEARRDAEDLAVHLAVPAVLLGEVSAATRKKESDGSTDAVKIPPEEVLLRLKLTPSLEKRVRETVERVHAATDVVGTTELTALTTPFVKDRQYPDPLDIMAALGSPRAGAAGERRARLTRSAAVRRRAPGSARSSRR